MKKKKDIIVFVENITKEQVKSINKYDNTLKCLLIRDIKRKHLDTEKKLVSDYVEYVDFDSPLKIAAVVKPYQERLLAITARAELGVNYLSKVAPHVPYLRTPTPESIQWTLDKYQMRRRLKLGCPQHTPKFTKVAENSKKERDRVIAKIGFPMIIKPGSLEASMLVTICYHEQELEKTLKNVFKKLKSEYLKLKRSQVPIILAEEFMDGDMYSIDSYVDSRGKIYHCPIVKIKTGRNIGHDDFYNYLRITPVNLKSDSIKLAQEATELGVHALGLRSTSTHTELMRIDNEWKIIEIGARIGGHRHDLHNLSCDIDHYLNDVLIRIPRVPKIPKKCKGYSAVMRFYPEKEGVIKQISGMKFISELDSVIDISVKLKVGDKVVYAKNGGKGIFDLTMYNSDRASLLADIRRIEKNIKVTVAAR